MFWCISFCFIVVSEVFCFVLAGVQWSSPSLQPSPPPTRTTARNNCNTHLHALLLLVELLACILRFGHLLRIKVTIRFEATLLLQKFHLRIAANIALHLRQNYRVSYFNLTTTTMPFTLLVHYTKHTRLRAQVIKTTLLQVDVILQLCNILRQGGVLSAKE